MQQINVLVFCSLYVFFSPFSILIESLEINRCCLKKSEFKVDYFIQLICMCVSEDDFDKHYQENHFPRPTAPVPNTCRWKSDSKALDNTTTEEDNGM